MIGLSLCVETNTWLEVCRNSVVTILLQCIDTFRNELSICFDGLSISPIPDRGARERLSTQCLTGTCQQACLECLTIVIQHLLELPNYVIYLNPLGKPKARSFISASWLSRIRCSRYTQNMAIDIKNDSVQQMNDLE